MKWYAKCQDLPPFGGGKNLVAMRFRFAPTRLHMNGRIFGLCTTGQRDRAKVKR